MFGYDAASPSLIFVEYPQDVLCKNAGRTLYLQNHSGYTYWIWTDMLKNPHLCAASQLLTERSDHSSMATISQTETCILLFTACTNLKSVLTFTFLPKCDQCLLLGPKSFNDS